MELPSTNIVRSGEGKRESVRSCLGVMRLSTVSGQEWVGLEAIGGGVVGSSVAGLSGEQVVRVISGLLMNRR
jgi:hypothetical protein